MTTGRQVDYLLWAAAEARRQRAQEVDRRAVEPDVQPRNPCWSGDGFVTEWQSAEEVSLSLK